MMFGPDNDRFIEQAEPGPEHEIAAEKGPHRANPAALDREKLRHDRVSQGRRIAREPPKQAAFDVHFQMLGGIIRALQSGVGVRERARNTKHRDAKRR